LAGKRGSFLSSSAKMQPTPHVSTASVYVSLPNSTSGALKQEGGGGHIDFFSGLEVNDNSSH
jgi:hypothetical protein